MITIMVSIIYYNIGAPVFGNSFSGQGVTDNSHNNSAISVDGKKHSHRVDIFIWEGGCVTYYFALPLCREPQFLRW
jgi:hypothetical protein